MENYIHHDAICEAYAENNITITIPGPFEDFDDVPVFVAEAVHAANGGNPWAELAEEKRRKKESRAKSQLNKAAVAQMTVPRLAQTDPDNEIRGWLTNIGQMMAAVDV